MSVKICLIKQRKASIAEIQRLEKQLGVLLILTIVIISQYVFLVDEDKFTKTSTG